jgi:hypothetical protein
MCLLVFEKDMFYTYYQHMLLSRIYVPHNFHKMPHYVALEDGFANFQRLTSAAADDVSQVHTTAIPSAPEK